jgi:hypothetical protein
MDAKTRYRQRLKVQAALTRVLEVLADKVAEQIPPDRTTAVMAWQVVRKLLPFIQGAGGLPDGSELCRFVYLKKARQERAPARYRRSSK